MKRQLINPPATGALYERLHFSQATRVGDMIWVSGQVGVDPTTMSPAVGMDAQARLAFEGVRTVLEAAGAGLRDIVELTTYHTDLRGDMPVFSRVKDEYLTDRYPSWTAVGVSQLALPELLVEIRAVAVAGSGDRTGIVTSRT
ncbi:RidA family protein [Streptomyces albofaciens JCM 4342]|uniref:RidA family protein n=1 Tax=Streptomyces albofaciens TaxID=66866 RepID=UPI000AC869F6|nr:RidA family protein [Streptomyces albofaciens]KAA6224012.1 RidA family protein [Streptomyces albofaciens JCM 4342]